MENKPNIQRPIVIGLVILITLSLIVLIWSIFARIESASIAPGMIIVHSKRKTIEHLEGGIVEEVYVKEGSHVKEGQVLIKLNTNQTKATYDLLRGKAFSFEATLARLQAERDGLDEISFSKELLAESKEDADIANVIDVGKKLFRARKSSFRDKINILNQRIEELIKIRESLYQQIASKERQLELLDEEVESVLVLFNEGLIGKPILLALQREQAKIEGETSELIGQIGNTNQKIGESELQIVYEKDSMKAELLGKYDEVLDEFYSTLDELKKAEDQYNRSSITSPADGVVVDLQVFSKGDVIRTGEMLMEIVPQDDRLIVEAFVDPTDIDVVHAGLKAKVRIIPFKQRNVPLLEGEVTKVSADIISNPENDTRYFLAYIEIAGGELEKLKGLQLQPGMPAEVMIISGERSPLYYILSPIQDSLERAFKEQ